MASQLNFEYARALQKASRELIGKTNQRDKLLKRDIDHHTPSNEHSAFVKKVSEYPNNEALPTFTPMTGRARSDSDARGAYWVIAAQSTVIMGVLQTTNLYLTDRGEIAVDRTYADVGGSLTPSVEKAKNTAYIADTFSVADLKRAGDILKSFDTWLARTNDELHDAWREEHPPPPLIVKMLTILSQK